ncbi:MULTISPECIES: hypothetical protein [unclassified Arthrobacter]|uniref:hypothetical protein n=1 Tax=unclassified Arthrobacter TaxID=235627 RepID=UPI001C84BE87|nr:hypothetical protein [Arthrobacter sp. MAHUQ-56]MBX7444508.1 hypothetical protein [Arthrobacter sp. MAHUQ-56]
MTLLRIHAEPEDAAVNPSDVAALVAATEPVEVRLDEVHAGPVQSAAADMTVRLVRGEPGFAYDPAADVLLVRLEHILSCFAGQDEDNATTIRANHIVAFNVLGELNVHAATVSAWIETNVYFIAYPYIRQFFTQMTAALGLPPVVLGYMKRDEWPFADATSETGAPAEEEPVNAN